MVSLQVNGLESLQRPLEQEVDHFEGARATVHVIPQVNHHIDEVVAICAICAIGGLRRVLSNAPMQAPH